MSTPDKVRFIDERETTRPLGSVANELKEEAKSFATTRFAMLQSEMQDKIATLKTAAPVLAGGALLLMTAWLLLTGALVALIWVAFAQSAFGPFLALVIVGASYLILGGIAVMFALKSIREKGLVPKRTIQILKDDKIWFQNEARTQL